MVDLVKQLREVKDRDFHPDSLRTMVLWGADEIDRLRAALKAVDETLQRHGWHETSPTRINIAEALASGQEGSSK